MRLLYHHRIRSKDGQYVHVEELIGALKDLGHELRIVGPSNLDAEDFGGESSALTWAKQRAPLWLYEILEFGYCFLDLSRLIVAIIRYKPEVIYERFNLFLPSGVWVHRMFRIPLFLEVNAPLFQERKENDGIGLPRLAKWTQDYTWRGATKCFPVTRVLADYLLEAGVPEENVLVIPNGINDKVFLADDAPSRASDLLPLSFGDSMVLGFVGFVRSWHGIDKLIELIVEPEFIEQRVTLLIVGDGPARSSLEQQARRLGVADRVHFTGIVPRDSIRSHIELFDVALQPNAVSYASPLKLFEYLAMGCAIIAPDAPNIREVLSNGDNALLIDPDNIESLKGALVRLAEEPTLRTSLGEAARRTVRQRGYTWAHNAERITKVFEEVIAHEL